MPSVRTSLPRHATILSILRTSNVEAYQRPEIEAIFELQRRAAIELMQKAGATGKRGQPFQVSRTSLLSWVERTVEAEVWQLQRQTGRH